MGDNNFIHSKYCIWDGAWVVLRDPSLEQFSLLCHLYPIPSSLKCAYCFFQVLCFFLLLLFLSLVLFLCALAYCSRLTIRLIAILLCSNWIICGFISHKTRYKNDLCHFVGIQVIVRHRLCKFKHAFDRICLSVRLERISTCGWHIHRYCKSHVCLMAFIRCMFQT